MVASTRPFGFRRVGSFVLAVWASVAVATAAQFVVQPPREGSLPEATGILLMSLVLAAIFVAPVFLVVGTLVRAALLLVERGGAARWLERLLASVLAGASAYVLLDGGLWWVLSGLAWPALIAGSALAAGWLLPTVPAAGAGV